MSRGLLIYHGGALNEHLDLFEVRLWEEGVKHPTVPKIAANAESAIRSFGPHDGVTWLSGPAATRKLAKVVGLTFRKRAPGAGRKRKEADDASKVVSVPVWMTPAGRDRLDYLRGKQPRGKFIERHLPLMK